MTRVSIDYDLMYALARQIWHLRDEMDVPSGVKHSFEAGDIGPRRDTAEALSDFSSAWQKAFTEGWQVMTDLGNLLDELGKAFYDYDAQTAAGAASMAAAYQRQNVKSANDAYKQRQDALYKQAEAANVERRHRPGQLYLERQQEALEKKRAALQKEQDAQAKRQEDLTKRQEELQKRQEPLRQRQDELTQRQQELWRRQKAERAELEAGFTAKQDALDKERAALTAGRRPSREQMDELRHKQQDLWQEQDAAQQALEGKQAAEQNALNQERDALRKKQDAFTPEWDELDKKQHDLWKDQAATEEAQKQLDRDQEPLTRRAEDMQKAYAEEQEEVARKPAWTPESGEPNPLHMNRELGGDGPAETPPPPVPTTYERDDGNGHTKIEYKLNADGEIEVDKNGNPVETTTTITNDNGMSYTETYRSLPREGDSVTTTHRADGSVTKVYVDANDEFYGKGFQRRYVTDEKGNTLQVWLKAPDGDWTLQNEAKPEGADDPDADPVDVGQAPLQYLERPPAYLTVDKPMVDATGKPADGAFAPGKTTSDLPGDATRTDYTNPDGSSLHVVTTDQNRYVADGKGEIQEVWQKNRDGDWYLKDSITQHERYGDEPPLGMIGENWR
ncbi:hypothetical protein [Streptomyces neyagawaensis]|uniref:hypothetical protein n=1 Tax=Streptomyces neyagawaensis TaxID=42238 RepID=UPI0006E3F8BB|nr:hypothetical protein [Streptomyces neyagawaensis]MCL6734803.1 hypothetical protein [Streptomyces neyagawaensis]MDE1686531.1 hypothetical protein [Streptomyces neyagawaensis]